MWFFKNKREERLKKRYKKRDEFWSSIGHVDKDVLSHFFNPAFMGMPKWPDLRQAYKIIKTKNTIIIATDGLSDDFEDEKNGNGLEIELFIESSDPKFINMTTQDLGNTWIFKTIFQSAANAVSSFAYFDAIEKYKYISSEYFDTDAPEPYITTESGLGVLLGIESLSVPTNFIFDNKEIKIISVTPILNHELEILIKNGRSAREKLVENLKSENFRNIVSASRHPLI